MLTMANLFVDYCFALMNKFSDKVQMQLGILKITFANGKAILSLYSLDKTSNSIFVDEKLNYSENEKR